MSLTLKVPERDDNGSHFGQGEIQTSLIGMNGSRGIHVGDDFPIYFFKILIPNSMVATLRVHL
jgi:hypothetical protein